MLVFCAPLPLAAQQAGEKADTPEEVGAIGPEDVRGYILFHSTVTDYDKLRLYGRAMVPIMQSFGGRFLVLADGSEALEGNPDTRRVAVIEFPSLADARAFYASAAYQAAKALRDGAGQFDAAIVGGLLPAGQLPDAGMATETGE